MKFLKQYLEDKQHGSLICEEESITRILPEGKQLVDQEYGV